MEIGDEFVMDFECSGTPRLESAELRPLDNSDLSFCKNITEHTREFYQCSQPRISLMMGHCVKV